MTKRYTAAAFIFCLLFTLLCGCGNGYVCVWRCAYMDTGDNVLTACDLKNAETDLSIDLRGNGIGYMTADGEIQKFAWTEKTDGSGLCLNVDGQMEDFLFDGEALVWDMEGVSVTFLPEKSEAYQTALSETSLMSATSKTK